jgi:hypothetical protein
MLKGFLLPTTLRMGEVRAMRIARTAARRIEAVAIEVLALVDGWIGGQMVW